VRRDWWSDGVQEEGTSVRRDWWSDGGPGRGYICEKGLVE
jgi:hypothetical protein